MKFLLGLIVGFLLAIGFSGRAEDWAVIMLRSHHFQDKNYEENNLGLGVERSLFGDYRLALGFYRNSERNTSLYGAAVYCPFTSNSGYWRGCGLTGLVTGYGGGPDPLAGLVLAYEGKEWGWNLLALPNKSGDFSAGVIALQVKRRF